MLRLLSALVVVAFPCAVACGGDDDAKDSGTFTTNVPDSTQLSDLTPDQKTALCADMDRFMSSPAVLQPSTELGCRMVGALFSVTALPMTDADARAACKVGYDACQQAPSTPTSMCETENTSCAATIAELKACMAEYPGLLSQTAESLPSCGTLTLADLGDMEGSVEITLGPGCSAIQQKCPSLLPDG